MPEEDNLELEDEVIEDEVVDTPEEEVIGDEPEEQDVIILEGEEPPEEEKEPEAHVPAPVWVKDLRQKYKETKRKLAEAESKISQVQAQPKVEDIGPEPDLADPDVEYDKDKFKKKLLEWNAKKQKLDEVQNKVKAEQEAQAKAWNDKVQAYDKAKKSLRVRDFDDAEELVKELFNAPQLSVILDGAKKPEEIIYALGKRPELAKEMAKEKNLARFAMDIGKLEEKVKSTRRTAPAPEKVVSARGGSPIAANNTLERLREEARKTGDSSKVIAYRREQAEKAKK